MIFFKQYLITLIFIVIAVWVIPAAEADRNDILLGKD